MTERAAFRASDVTRAVKGLKQAGECLGQVKIDPTGTIVVIPAGKAGEDEERNEWDDA